MEKNIKKVITGAKKFRKEQEEKQYQKFWAEIKVPFTLDEGLKKYTKYELDAIRKTLNIKNASTLKKGELIALLQERIPEYLEYIAFHLDLERFRLLTNIANNSGQMIAPMLKDNQIEYFRKNGLLYTGTFEGKKILAVPDELVEQISAWKNNVKLKAAVSRNTEWIKLTRGILYYYGTLSGTQLVNMLEEFTKETVDFAEYLTVIHRANSYHKEIYIDERYFSNNRVLDPERVQKEHQSRSSVPFYPFTKQQLLAAGEPGFVEKNQSYMQLVKFLTNNFEIDREEADDYAEEMVYAARIGDGPNDVLSYLSHTFELDDMEIVQYLTDKITHLMNNTREWFLKGYTSTELFAQEKKHLRPLPTTKLNSSDDKKAVKVGRNDPCPCGSGKKYKKCCGR
ncbi:hypothetical protein CIL05_09540 [Virgibacillus profundi]|uniref:Zinc chelation protein SecC n=1 Tax=Virgibacillus profundi TaxID=2024555 RepID=A0A2A2IFH9_9BACI|nr:hypothetical protein CIL05_09540 [Virgibacillus profundi]PXY54004.1 hypothetical protein CIT14_09630 [Virgibacillus profundi]